MLSSCFMLSSFFMSSFFAFFLDFLSFFMSSFFMLSPCFILSSCFMLSCFMASPDCAKAESDTVRRHIAINLRIILFMNFSPIHARIDAEEPWAHTWDVKHHGKLQDPSSQ